MKLDQILNEFDRMSPVIQVPSNSSLDESFDIIVKRLGVAKRMYGLTNKLTNPEERRAHRSKITGFLNQLRAQLKWITQEIAKEDSRAEYPEAREQDGDPWETRAPAFGQKAYTPD